jgi:hypothetical protein
MEVSACLIECLTSFPYAELSVSRGFQSRRLKPIGNVRDVCVSAYKPSPQFPTSPFRQHPSIAYLAWTHWLGEGSILVHLRAIAM